MLKCIFVPLLFPSFFSFLISLTVNVLPYICSLYTLSVLVYFDFKSEYIHCRKRTVCFLPRKRDHSQKCSVSFYCLRCLYVLFTASVACMFYPGQWFIHYGSFLEAIAFIYKLRLVSTGFHIFGLIPSSMVWLLFSHKRFLATCLSATTF